LAVGERPDWATFVGGVAILVAMVIDAMKPDEDAVANANLLQDCGLIIGVSTCARPIDTSRSAAPSYLFSRRSAAETMAYIIRQPTATRSIVAS
jgi:hypothetical protein